MNRKIINGHTAVFCKDIQPESGDIVAVMIDHEDATVKQFHETSIAVMFEPMSWDPSFKPYVFKKDEEQDFRILGRYIYDTSESI
ncbi:LexA family protein [Lacticaseibacillus manihotivorans]|nr:S24 family peptidase [Lacticaseibacillus manihotivorans]